MDRREFLRSAAASGVIWFAPRGVQRMEARVEVLIDEPIGTISPDLYGHFAEHLGGFIYDGI